MSENRMTSVFLRKVQCIRSGRRISLKSCRDAKGSVLRTQHLFNKEVIIIKCIWSFGSFLLFKKSVAALIYDKILHKNVLNQVNSTIGKVTFF